MKRKPRCNPRLLFLALPMVWCIGCVGPTTPLGAVDQPAKGYRPAPPPRPVPDTRPAEEPQDSVAQRSEIIYSPAYQRVHGPYTWQVAVVDPARRSSEDLSRIRVFYNDMEVTESARTQFKSVQEVGEYEGRSALLLTMPHLRLDPLTDHRIRVDYTTADGETISCAYEFPTLGDFHAQEPLATTEPFEIEPEILDMIKRASREYEINPVVLAALIAQESSFNPRALSRARALGLTQVTHSTEPDIASQFPGWPRNPRLGRFSRRQLRRLIPEVINEDNEWRLDPEKSIRGGAYYLGYLRDRLTDEANRQYVAKAGPDRDRNIAKASLAAYNSGLNRVLYMMKAHGDRWLEQKPTREAKRYVRRILSYYGAFREEPPIRAVRPGEAS